MATQYEGVYTGIRPPSPAAGDGVSPILNLPDDGDDLNVSSVLQPFMALADFAAFAMYRAAGLMGVRAWETTATYTQGMMVFDLQGVPDCVTFRVKIGQTATVGVRPHSDLGPSGKWEQWAMSPTELIAYLNVVFLPSIGASHGSVTLPGSLKVQWEYLTVSLGGLPGDANAFTHTYQVAFNTSCFAPIFQPEVVTGTGNACQIRVADVTKTTCSLLQNHATNLVQSGWLITIGY